MQNNATGTILPGATIGVLGSGQLGRMFALAARRLGYRVHTLSPDRDTPTGQIADVEITAGYDDLDAVRAFARGVQVITFEFENVPATAAAAALEYVPVRPRGSVLETTQHRLREKRFLVSQGIPLAPFRAVTSAEETLAVVRELGLPVILKTAGFGYDGKGQRRINHFEECGQAFHALNVDQAVVEGFVDFARECSVVAARGVDGSFAHYGVVENVHRHHVLDVTTAPARVSSKLATEAVAITHHVLEALDVVGVLCVEFFVTMDEKLLVNELAPRPHNSGHFTIDACTTSQFEQQLRAVCGLPLGATTQQSPAAMANLLGDTWQKGEPNWAAALSIPEVRLHLYGKLLPRPGRKMGHLTAVASTGEEARSLVLQARERLLMQL